MRGRAGPWERRYQLHGREHYLGLGPVSAFGLTEARNATAGSLKVRPTRSIPWSRGGPSGRNGCRKRLVPDLRRVRRGVFQNDATTWKHHGHAAQWRATILGCTLQGKAVKPDKDYCPRSGMPVQAIDTPILIPASAPALAQEARNDEQNPSPHRQTFSTGPRRPIIATATTLQRGRHREAVARAHQGRQRVQHFEAVGYDELPTFMADLRQCHGNAARALEFAILTATRTAEVIEAMWPEFDLKETIWVIPAERMKADREHRVPLTAASDRAAERDTT